MGTALHTGIEEGVAQALEFYQNSFPVLTDEHINEMIKLEALIPKAAALLPPGGRFELPIGNADFIGFMDYLAPVFKDTFLGLNYYDRTCTICTISSIPTIPKATWKAGNFTNTSIGLS